MSSSVAKFLLLDVNLVDVDFHWSVKVEMQRMYGLCEHSNTPAVRRNQVQTSTSRKIVLRNGPLSAIFCIQFKHRVSRKSSF